MALAPSSLSLAVRSVAEFLTEGLDADDQTVTVTVGSPHEAGLAAPGRGHRVNLFLFRIEPDAFDATRAPDLPLRLRLHCLVTAFAVDEDNVSAGETDLRLLGEVIRLFHEHPTLDAYDDDGATVRLHAVLEPMTVEALSSVWSNQHETSVRPSVAYEIALAPIATRRKRVAGPLAGAFGVGAAPDGAARTQLPQDPEVGRSEVDVARDGWVPHLAWVAAGRAAYALTVTRSELPGLELSAWIAGRPGAPVSLRWQTWRRERGWIDGATVAAPAGSSAIDPEGAAAAPLTAVAPPAFDGPGQATLRAVRSWRRPDGATVELQSNVVLLTIVEDGA